MRRVLVSAIAVVLLGSACGIEAITGATLTDASPEPRPTLNLTQNSGPPPASELPDVIDRVLPSVVNIQVEAIEFGIGSAPQEVSGQGSGVVIDAAGIILTNAHVVADSTEVTVVFNDDHGSLPGEVLGLAPEKDIAVVKVDADDLTPVELGRSRDLRLGHEVVAIGFPLGLGGTTVTKGIVSALDRNIEVNGAAALEGLIQTDAAINPGNSGGALVDLAGRLVGINTAAAQAGAAENIGFAIPIDSALPVAEEIISEPPEERAWLGVQIQSIESAATAAQIGLDPSVRGVLIMGLFPDSAAGRAGIEEGDLIVRLANRAIRSADDLTQALTRFDPGDKVDITVLRATGEEVIEVTLAQRPASID